MTVSLILSAENIEAVTRGKIATKRNGDKMSGFPRKTKTNLTPKQLELFHEYEAMCQELIDHVASLWWAFDSKDSRAIMIRKIADAYSSRLCAANCGMIEPETTECIEDELRGMMDRKKGC